MWNILKVRDSSLEKATTRLVYSFAYDESGYTMWVSDLESCVWSEMSTRRSIIESENGKRSLIDLNDNDQFDKMLETVAKRVEQGEASFYVGEGAAMLELDGQFGWQFGLTLDIKTCDKKDTKSKGMMDLGMWCEPLLEGIVLRDSVIENLVKVIHAKDIHLRALGVLVGPTQYTPRRDAWALERFDRLQYFENVKAKQRNRMKRRRNVWDLVEGSEESELGVPSVNAVNNVTEEDDSQKFKRRRIGDVQRKKRGMEDDQVYEEEEQEQEQGESPAEYLQSPDRRKRVKTVSKNVIGGGGVSKNTIGHKLQETDDDDDGSVKARRAHLQAQIGEQARSRRRRQWL